MTSLMILAILIIIGGLRDHIGWDYNSYINWYLKGTRDYDLEFGFLGILKIFRHCQLNYKFLFFTFSFFTYLFVYLGIRKITNKSTLPLVLYFMIPVLFLYSFTYIRQFLSVAIAFYAFGFLLDKRYLNYFLLMFLGISIHYSCLIPCVVFLIIFFWGEFVKIRHIYILLILSFFISQIGLIHFLSIFLKDSHYLYYVSNRFAVPVPLFKLLLLNFVGIMVLWYYTKFGFQFSNQKYLVLVYISSLIVINIFSESTELCRIYIYFRIFEIIIFADIVRYALLNKKGLIIAFFCFFYLGQFFRAIQIDYEKGPENLKLIPYKSIIIK